MTYMNTALSSRRDNRRIASFLTGFARLHDNWRQRQALKHLDADALLDIGLTRHEADAEARRSFWDAPEQWRT